MQFFLDSADLTEIRRIKAMGLLDGLTTNPSLIAKTGRDFATVTKEILAEVDGPVSLEVLATDTEGMISEGLKLAALGKNVVVKIPMLPAGMEAVKTFTKRGIATNVTLCFSPTQALIAAKAGATYISPFIGRLDDVATDGMSLIHDIVQIYRNYEFATQVLVASVRHPIHVRDAALAGADCCTVPCKILEQLYHHPLTDKGLAQFLEDWEKVPKS